MKSAIFLAGILFATVPMARAEAAYGILLLAHGGDRAWNAEVEKLRAEASSSVPVELALGMADTKTLQAGVDRLETQGVKEIVAVPLFVNSRSEILDQTRYALGLTEKPSEVLRRAAKRMEDMPMPASMGMGSQAMSMFSLERVTHRAKIVFAFALDGDPFVSTVLLDRAKELSREPKRETVILVAHGPVDDAAVVDWQKALTAHAAALAKAGGFRAVKTALLRDDSEPAVRTKAVARLRALVVKVAAHGRALVVPVLISRGGIEEKIPHDLAGLSFAWSGEALLPHAGFDQWILRSARQAFERK